MGWFSSDEIIVESNTNEALQTVALIVLAVVFLGYGLIKIFNNHHRSQSERVAEAAVRMRAAAI